MESRVTNRIWGRNKTASFLLGAGLNGLCPPPPPPPPTAYPPPPPPFSAMNPLLHCLNHMSEGACDWTLVPQMTAVIAPSSQTHIK